MDRPLLRLLPVMILNIVELGIALPVLPALALALNASAFDIGLLFMLQALGQFLTAPLWGRLSDRFGRKSILMVTFALAAFAEIATAFAPNLLLLFIARFVVGLCAGNVAAASAYIADVTDDAGRSRGMAVIGVSFGLGFTIGPAIGALVSYLTPNTLGIYGLGMPFLIAGLLSLFTLLLTALVLHEPPVSPEERAHRRQNRIPIRQILATPAMSGLLGMFFVYTLTASVLEATFFLYASEIFSLKTEHIGATFAGLGLLLAFMQGSVGRVARQLGDRRMVILGVLMCSTGLILAMTTQDLSLFLIFVGIATAGRAYMHPGLLSLTSKIPPDAALAGSFLGVLQSSGSLGRIVGPAVGGWTYEFIGPRTPFILAGGVLLTIGLCWYVLGNRETFKKA